MRNYLRLGPVSVRVSRRYLANWGFPLLQIGGLSLFDRDNCGRLHLAGYHPRGCLTWHWFLALYRADGKNGWFNLQWRPGHGEKGLHLFGWTLGLYQQAYHKQAAQ